MSCRRTSKYVSARRAKGGLPSAPARPRRHARARVPARAGNGHARTRIRGPGEGAALTMAVGQPHQCRSHRFGPPDVPQGWVSGGGGGRRTARVDGWMVSNTVGRPPSSSSSSRDGTFEPWGTRYRIRCAKQDSIEDREGVSLALARHCHRTAPSFATCHSPLVSTASTRHLRPDAHDAPPLASCPIPIPIPIPDPG